MSGRALARIDLAAVRDNAALLARAAGRAELMAVVKADGYGHGAAPVARAALAGGARRLAVATVAEAEELRGAGLGGPLLVMGPLAGGEWARAAAARAEVAVWTPEGLAAAAAGGARRPVHLKLDTGMGRLGARPEDVPALADAAAGAAGAGTVEVVGLMSHFATADEVAGENAGFMGEQLLRFRAAAAGLRPRFPGARAHIANSAATLRDPAAALDVVRCGIALYGCDPFGADPAAHGLRPAMSLVSYVASVKTIRSRESVGYGRRWRAARGTRVAVVPVGYADGYARALGGRAEVLVGGRRVPVIGAVSMDQVTVDLGPEGAEGVGDEVVLIGAQGEARVTAEEVAAWRGTINYEVTCAVGPRVPRAHSG
ncbi:alanine racemase [Miltoncostaea marina]|uniref:alanine racemase n=1 Tax=Miltoncostaea marina TaxID=2843215 RepID=UPI001C3E64A1|nr:alanine racemase [Miltoncostaea marina]